MERDHLTGRYLKGHRGLNVRHPKTGRFISKEQWSLISSEIDTIIVHL